MYNYCTVVYIGPLQIGQWPLTATSASTHCLQNVTCPHRSILVVWNQYHDSIWLTIRRHLQSPQDAMCNAFVLRAVLGKSGKILLKCILDTDTDTLPQMYLRYRYEIHH